MRRKPIIAGSRSNLSVSTVVDDLVAALKDMARDGTLDTPDAIVKRITYEAALRRESYPA